jgi:hypothetical protein
LVDVYHNVSNFSTTSWGELVAYRWDNDDVSFILDQHVLLD